MIPIIMLHAVSIEERNREENDSEKINPAKKQIEKKPDVVKEHNPHEKKIAD